MSLTDQELELLTNNNIEIRDQVARIVTDFHKDLNALEWPKVLYVKDGKTFQELVVALRVEVDWHFEETDEGFPYFLIGPTMVRVDNQAQATSAQLVSFADGFAQAAKKTRLVEKYEPGLGIYPEGGIHAGNESESTS